MTSEQKAWMRRIEEIGRPVWNRWVQPNGRGRIRMAPLRVYGLGMRLHRWLWVRGIEL